MATAILFFSMCSWFEYILPQNACQFWSSIVKNVGMVKLLTQLTSQLNSEDNFTFSLQKFQRLENVEINPNSRYISCHNFRIFFVFFTLYFSSEYDDKCPYPPKFDVKIDFLTFVILNYSHFGKYFYSK